MVKVGGMGVPRLDPDLKSSSAAVSGCGIEVEPLDKQLFQNMIRKKLPFCRLATYPRDLKALTSSRDILGQSIISDSWSWWDRLLDFSGFGGVLSCCEQWHSLHWPLFFSLLSPTSLCLTNWAHEAPGALCGCFIHRFSPFLSAVAPSNIFQGQLFSLKVCSAAMTVTSRESILINLTLAFLLLQWSPNLSRT